ncbi:MAG: primosomal protein N' [Clostridiales bacterium]|nr:primosomal protein N' [Clostridiales bacterium]MCF8022719.1 primosomal protein N' [Clostridiales bacterium]
MQKSLHYKIPEEMQSDNLVGSRVLIPLGNRQASGFVVGLAEDTSVDRKLKSIIKLLDQEPVLTKEQLRIARWISGYYFSSPQRTLQAIAHPVLNKTRSCREKHYYVNFSIEELNRVTREIRRAPKQVAVLNTTARSPGLTKKQLSEKACVSYTVIDTLISKGYLYFKEVMSDVNSTSYISPVKPELTGEQAKVVKNINFYLQKNVHKVFLLHGVTGSGKTEVYLRCIDCALQLKKSAIVLVPEISLTPQMIRCFKERLGNRVALLHSRMSKGERYEEWNRISQGHADVILGTRSAIFSPVNNLGIIVIDEEHEFTYKQGESPRYHARAVALYRAYVNSAAVVLGSATPSLESYCRAKDKGPYTLLKMDNRVDNIALPFVKVVDMRKEFSSGNKAIFGSELFNAVNKRLEDNEQVILFLNRRGFNTFVVCRECGMVLKCPNCDISLTYHHQGDLRCHYCNYSQMAPSLCPGCRSKYIGYFGTGTQKVEKEAKDLFPQARIIRMDADTTGRKGAHYRILKDFEERKADILIGTQMVAKGLNFSGVTLVGIISADTGLYIPDFRSAERTFQLITQVAGRSGRAKSGGEVIVQTFNPEHYAVTAAAAGDYEGFFKEEMNVRKEMQYPPYSRMIRLLFFGKDENKVNSLAEAAFKILQGYINEDKGIIAVGPSPAPLTRVRGNYRLHIVLWSKDEEILRDAVKKTYDYCVKSVGTGKNAGISVDVDPYSMI